MEEARANINNLLKIMTNSIFLSEFRDSQHTHTQCYYTSNSSGRWVLDASTCMFNTLSIVPNVVTLSVEVQISSNTIFSFNLYLFIHSLKSY